MLTRVAFLAVLAAAPAHAALVPHEARYDLALVKASDTYGPRAMDGVLEERVTHTCGGWETRTRVRVNAVFRDDITSANERIFTSWESDDGTGYRFAVQTRKNDIVVESFQGTAKLGKSGGQVTYEPTVEKGRKVKVPLPRDTFLPVAYQRALLDHASAGDVLFTGVVLNGASSTGPRVQSTAIGPRERAAGAADAPAGRDLDGGLLGPAWPMSLAFYNLFAKSDAPLFETVLREHESGVADEITQTFTDFTVAAHLTFLKRIDSPPCRGR